MGFPINSKGEQRTQEMPTARNSTVEWSGKTTEEELIRRADKAMYAAKDSGGNAYRFCARLH